MKFFKTRVFVLAVCVVMLACLSMGATLAFFSDAQEGAAPAVMGRMAITLDEAKVNAYGQPVDREGNPVDQAEAPRVAANNYVLMRGATYYNDPTVHIGENGGDCWVFVKVENGNVLIEGSIAPQMSENGWTLLPGTANIYAYKQIAKAGDDLTVFERFTIPANATQDELDRYKDAQLRITAYAVQAYGFDTAQQAWNAVKLGR